MPRVIRIQSARQRYATVPVIDPETGLPKHTPVMVKKFIDGEYREVQKTTKTGRPVTMAVTISDKEKPLPPLRCDFPGCQIDGGQILVGTPYKHISIKMTYGGRQLNRHQAHPDWQQWEYSSSRSAQVARQQADMHSTLEAYEFSSVEDFDDIKQQLQDMAQEQLDEQEDALGNMPEQLQDGSQAQEYRDALEEWVNEFDQADAPDDSDNTEDCQECEGTGKVSCETCEGSGFVDSAEGEESQVECVDCGGDGETDCPAHECEGGQVPAEGVTEEWVEAAREALSEAIDAVQI